MSYREQAVEKLTAEYGEFKGDRYQKYLKKPVFEQLIDFCQKNEEFAQAVAQGGTFADCMDVVSKGVGEYMPDCEAYRRAAAFYFAGATVVMELRIQLEPAETDSRDIVIDLSDFF